MDQEDLSTIEEAWKTKLKDESFERSLGRALRRRGLEFSLYIRIMGEIREAASREGVSPDDYVKSLLKK